MGSVWKCRDSVLDRTVALKLLPESHAAEGDARRRFLREARAASRRDDTSRLTSSGAALGTIAYLAPELILGRRCNAQSDVYGLGVVFYEMVTGTLPFRGERPEALLYATVNEPLEPPSGRRPGVPAGVDEIAVRALAREPGERFTGAAEFARALRAIDGSAIERVPAAPPRPSRSGDTRQRPQATTPFI